MKEFALLLLPSLLGAAEVALDFAVQPGSQATLSYQVGTQLTDPFINSFNQARHQATVGYSGNILATAEFNPSSGTIESIEFTGGEIVTGNTSAVLQVFVGNTPYNITFSTNGITRTTSSSEVDVLSSGLLNGDLHFTTLTSGTINLSNFNANTGSPSVFETFNLATDTSDLISHASLFPASTGAATLGAALSSSGLLANTYQANFFSILAVPTLSPDATMQAAGLGFGQNFRQRYHEIGTLSAKASFSAPTAFGQWSIDNELGLTTGFEENNSGYPYSLLYAFDLSPNALALPLSFVSHDPVVVQLTPPSGGLKVDIEVQYSSDLTSDFAPIDSAQIARGPSALTQGSTSPIEITFPAGSATGFLRFAIPE